MQFRITAIVAVVLLVSVESSCPSSGCECTENSLNVNCSSRGLESIPTDLPNNTDEIELQYNDISVIENNAFNNLPHLKYLHLHHNKITSIKSGTLNNLTKLYRLELQYNDISVIENNAFNNLPRLQFLHLHHNKITSIKSGTLNNLTKLYWLELQYNDISVIENNAFNNLPKLKQLKLNSNDISVIEDNTFNNLPKLHNLSLGNNDISVIEDNVFNNLPSLQYLYLYDNNITSIKSDTFNNLTNLNKLFLRNNSISYVSESAFVNLPKLTELHFDMYCRGCGNIPFWRWLKTSQKFTTSVTCNDYDGESLAILQPNNYTNCFMDPCYSNPCLSNGQCTLDGIGSALCSCHGDWTGSQCELSPCSTVVCNDGECYYNESGIAKCFNKAATKSDDNHTAVYTGVGAFIAGALVAVIIVLATLRYRTQPKRSTSTECINTDVYATNDTTVANDSLNSGDHSTKPKSVSTIPEVVEDQYDAIQTSTALRHA